MRAIKRPLVIAMCRKCYSVEETAQAAGVSAQTVQSMLRGEDVTIKTFGLVCRALDADPADILMDEDGEAYTARGQIIAIDEQGRPVGGAGCGGKGAELWV